MADTDSLSLRSAFGLRDPVETTMDRRKMKHAGPRMLLLMLIMMLGIAVLLVYLNSSGYRFGSTGSTGTMDQVLHMNSDGNQLEGTRYFEVDEQMTGFPLTGFAPYAEDTEKCRNTQLVFIRLRWADFEPEEGVFDTDFIESTYHVSEYKKAGKHAVLRFVCDIPGDEPHADIPQWLMDKTEGVYYHHDYGQGYCPDYSDKVFMEYHSRAIKQLADYCSQTGFVAFVELGSLGHWGEWHCKDSSGDNRMPSASVCEQYVQLYCESFSNVKFLMRRNYEIGQNRQIGLFNDMIGDSESYTEWTEWLENGGVQETSDLSDSGTLQLTPAEEAWKTSPVGGEFTSSISMEELLGDQLEDTLQEIDESHLTFIGPHSPGSESAEYEELLSRLGYRIYISKAETTYIPDEGVLQLQLTWENAGSAPFYFDWPCKVQISNRNGKVFYLEELDIHLSELIPGTQIITTSSIPYSEELDQEYILKILIRDFDGNQQKLLAMSEEL